MDSKRSVGYRIPLRSAALVALAVGLLTPAAPTAQSGASSGAVTFTKDIAPILQRSCQHCHRADGIAPMPLTTYEEVRPWARAIKTRTGLGSRRGAMPPWFVEKDIGIQKYKNDPSLSEEEIASIAKWVDSGAPRGNPADMPPPRQFAGTDAWTIGTPDLVVRGPGVTVPAVSPDIWGMLTPELVPTAVAEDRYVSALEIREVNDIPKSGADKTVGARWVYHHQTLSTVVKDASGNVDPASRVGWPVHEVGRNADIFAPEVGRLLAANSFLSLDNSHLHANGRETKAHLEFGFKFFPKGYKPLYRRASSRVANSTDLAFMPNQANQEFHAYTTLQEHTKIVSFEPHMHGGGTRMCLEAIWGTQVEQLTCVGYDHSWVRGYTYEDDSAPLLPKGTIVHIIGFFDTTPANKNIPDPRNWTGAGRRSVSQMFNELGYWAALTEEQFQAEMAKRRATMKSRNDYAIGCPLCWAPPAAQRQRTAAQGN